EARGELERAQPERLAADRRAREARLEIVRHAEVRRLVLDVLEIGLRVSVHTPVLPPASSSKRAGRMPARLHVRGSAARRSSTPGFDLRSAANASPAALPRYRPAIAARTGVTSISTSSAAARTSRPRNGGTASNTTRTHIGSRARCASFTSPFAI